MLAACHSARVPDRVAPGVGNNHVPALCTASHVSTNIDNSPRYLTGVFAIGPQGMLFNPDDRGDGLLYSVLDSTGQVIRRTAKRGDGPGEVRGEVIDVSDSAYIVRGMSPARLSRFTLEGVLLESSPVTEQANSRLAVTPRETIALQQTQDGFLPVIISISTGKIRSLVSRPDSFLASFPPQGILPNGSVRLPILGRWPGGFIAADGFKYRLALYSWDGHLQRILSRNLPPPRLSEARIDREFKDNVAFLKTRHSMGAADMANVREQIASRPQPFFLHNRDSQIGLDGEGRIWVVGIDADSGFADIFSSTQFLGRIPLPCPGFEQGWSLKGKWLAIACKPDDPEFAGDAVFKVFRIEG